MKLKLTPRILRLAYRFIDVESLGESSVLDGRTIEYGFVISRLARLPVGKLLDVGCVARVNPVVSTMCELGWKVYGIDIRDYKYTHPNFKFIRGDITEQLLRDDFFDAIIAISTLEHIGIKGRYGIKKGEEGKDLFTVGEIRKYLKPGGTLIITLPYNEASKTTKLGRIYTPSMVDRLVKNWVIRSRRVQNGLILLDLVKGKE